MFPNITELIVNKGNLTDLDLTKNENLEKLKIHYCSKLERILLPENHKLKEVVIENCKNLDLSNLPTEVTSVWPPRKENVATSSAQGEIQSTGNKQIDDLLHDLKKNMEDYMNEAEPSYNQSDIRDCLSILTDYTIRVLATKSKDEGVEVAKSAVLKLNDLNEKCGYSLIETNEREQIAELIILAGNEMGYNSVDEDITEQWREW
jgi:hypothetical protein